LHFLVQRPAKEPGFLLTRAEGKDRQQTYSVHSYATSADGHAPGRQ
jgi:ribulose-bisphosphate carboxylase small chain